MSALVVFRSGLLCIIFGSSGPAQCPAAAELAAAFPGVRLALSAQSTAPAARGGPCLVLELARSFRVTACWPDPGGAGPDDRGSAVTLAALHDEPAPTLRAGDPLTLRRESCLAPGFAPLSLAQAPWLHIRL